MPLTSQLTIGLTGAFTKAKGQGSSGVNLAAQGGRLLATGTAAFQADLIYQAIGATLGASATLDIDLIGSAQQDALGDNLAFVKVKGIWIHAYDANVNDVKLGGAAATIFVGPFGAGTHTVAVGPGGDIVLSSPSAGWTVGAGTTDFLRITNGGAGTSVTYDAYIWGTSA